MLTNEQWALVQPLLPASPPPGHPGRPAHDRRRVLDAILLVLSYRIPWRRCQITGLSYHVVYKQFCCWRDQGVLEKIFYTLLEDVHTRGNFNPQQAVKNKLVNFTQQGDRLIFLVADQLTRDASLYWQMEIARLYYQALAAYLEQKIQLSTQPDPLLSIFIKKPVRSWFKTPGSSGTSP